jgi:hypothetical protein
VIISDEHRYVFVEQPHTACTAIRDELVAHYGGRPILDRHATYAAFLRIATPAQKRYFVFSGLRNPLDERVSLYCKYRADHHHKYSRRFRRLAERQQHAFVEVAAEHADFATFLRHYHRRPYDNDMLVHHARMDDLIRFERLQDDFARVLRRLGLAQVRPLPVVNPTAGRGDYLTYYPPEIRPHAVRVFGPFMRRWGYELPPEWGDVRVPLTWTVGYRVLGAIRYVYRRYLDVGRLNVRRPASNAVVRRLGPITRPLRRALLGVFGPLIACSWALAIS